jgi:hypothetical protein
MPSTINASTSSGIVQTADTSGVLELQSAGTTKLTVASTGAYGQLISGTAVASTSGTSIDFTSIPSWVKRITVMFNGVSSNGGSNFIVQLGDSGGVETTGYASVCIFAGGSNEAGGSTQTGGLLFTTNSGSSGQIYGTMILNSFGSNSWFATGTTGYNLASLSAYVMSFTGAKTLSATLDRIRITTVNGTDTFDAGSINILYEG